MQLTQIGSFLLIMILAIIAAGPGRAAQNEDAPLDRLSHIHGLAVAPSRPVGLLLATHNGLFLASPEGSAKSLGGLADDLMSFVAHPQNPGVLYAGGHNAKGGNIGVLMSSDGGNNWRRISQGVPRQSGFHRMVISRADPKVMYGVDNKLHVSVDGGISWRNIGPYPKDMIDFAASSNRVNTLFAATRNGLLISNDQGWSWDPVYAIGRPATMVYTPGAGQVYTFVAGVGLAAATEPELSWQLLSDRFADRVIIRMTADPANPRRLYAAMLTGAVMTSSDGGRTWTGYEGSHNARPEAIAKGKVLFEEHCQTCHGAGAKGQDPASLDPKTPNAVLAPALDDSAHAWHHSDNNLVKTILEGSPREGSPMTAWKDKLSRGDAEIIVAYFKSLWNFRSLACQGARHMACMRRN